MSTTVLPVFANADPTANPTSVPALVTYLNTLFETVNVQGGPFTPYVISSTTPVVGDQDKIWAKTDGNGRPLGLFLFYNGNWRRFYSGRPSQITMFSGSPTTYFDGTGLGTLGGDWDGWALCNGQNGTPNLSNLFIVGGAMDNAGITGYSGGHWNTNVVGGSLQTGGAASHSIVNSDLPNMTVNITGKKYDGAGSGGSPPVKHVIVTDNWSNNNDFTDPTPAAVFGANPPANPQTAVSTVPPFYSLAYCQFVGYA